MPYMFLNQVQPLPTEDIDVKMKTLESYKFMKLVIFTVAGLFFGVFIGVSQPTEKDLI